MTSLTTRMWWRSCYRTFEIKSFSRTFQFLPKPLGSQRKASCHVRSPTAQRLLWREEAAWGESMKTRRVPASLSCFRHSSSARHVWRNHLARSITSWSGMEKAQGNPKQPEAPDIWPQQFRVFKPPRLEVQLMCQDLIPKILTHRIVCRMKLCS